MSIYAITPFIYTEPHEFVVGPYSATIDVANIYNYNTYSKLQLNSGDTLYVVGCELFASNVYEFFKYNAVNIYIDKINEILEYVSGNILVSNLYIENSPESVTLRNINSTTISLQTTKSIRMRYSTITDFSKCPALTQLQYNKSSLSSTLTFADNGANLEILDLTDTTGIQTLSFTPTNLKELIIPNTSINDIQTLISNATQLTKINISNGFTGASLTLPATITDINVSNNPSLTSITGFTQASIISLDISSTGITLNDFSSYTSMTNLNVEGNNTLTSLIVPSSLTSLNANNLTLLTALNGITDISQFVSFQIGSTKVTGFTDFSNCANLTTLDLSNIGLTTLALPTTSNAWEILNLSGNPNLNITLPEFKNLDSLKILNLENCNLITTIIVQDCPNATVNVPNTAEIVNLINIDNGTNNFSGFTNLTELMSTSSTAAIPTSSTLLTKLLIYTLRRDYDLATNYPNITSLTCKMPNSVIWTTGNDKITELSILNATSTSFTIDFAALPINLTKFSFTENITITELDLTAYTSLTYIDVSKCSNLTTLSYPDTITYLDISNTKISEINKNILPNLTYLNINRSSVQNLTIQNSTNLTYINTGSLNWVDLQGCSNANIILESNTTFIHINLNGCVSAYIYIISINKTTEFADLSNIASVDIINCSDINFTSEAFMNVLNANKINSISFRNCTAGDLDLSNKSTTSVGISGGQYKSITLQDNLAYLSVTNMQTPISISSCYSFDATNANVTCENIEGNVAKSVANNGNIGNITMSNILGPNIFIEKCNTININNCLNINMGNENNICTYADSINIINSTFYSMSLDYNSGSIDLSGSTFGNTKEMFLSIKNYKSENINNFPATYTNAIVLFNCPNFDLTGTTCDQYYIIKSKTSTLPNTGSILLVIDCDDLTNFDGTFQSLRIYNCKNLESINMTNVERATIVGNKNLKYVTYNNIEYGITNPIDDFINMFELGYMIFRFNGFQNVNFISNPNFVNGDLVYDENYTIQIASNDDILNSSVETDKTKNFIYTGLVKILSGDLGEDYLSLLYAFNIFIDFNNAYTFKMFNELYFFEFKNMNEEGLTTFKNLIDSTSLMIPTLVITEYPSSVFDDLKRRDNINVISLSDTPQPPLEPNMFSVKFIM